MAESDLRRSERAEDPLDSGIRRVSAAKAHKPAPCVLIADDNESVRGVLEQMLRAEGCDVVSVENGEQAVATHRLMGDQIDFAMLDLSMPIMGGYEAFQAIRSTCPQAGVVLCSGSPDPGLIQRALAEGMCRFVQKPYTAAVIAGVVRAMSPKPGM